MMKKLIQMTGLKNEIKWVQKSRVNWLKWGDHNSKFFHLSTISRRVRNSILAIKNDKGDWVQGHEAIQNVTHGYFSKLFKSDSPSQEHIHNITKNYYLFMSDESKSLLEREFCDEGIKMVMFQMEKLKALGLDDFQAGFFQEFWDIVGDDVTGAVKDFF